MRKFFGALAAFSIVFSTLPGISVADTEPGVLIVKFSDVEAAENWAARGFALEPVYDMIYRLTTADATGTATWLAGETGVEFVERDNVLRASANASDPLFVLDEKELTKQWYLPKIQIHQAWNRAEGSNVTIEVVDTGIDARGAGLASDGAAGIRWAADNGARIINLSIGGQGRDGVAVLQDAITYAFNKGVLIVAAAGNDSAESGGSLNSAPVLPGCADGGANMVGGVAATDI